MKLQKLSNGDFQFAPNQRATEWHGTPGTAQGVNEIVTAKAVDAIVNYLAEHQPDLLKGALAK